MIAVATLCGIIWFSPYCSIDVPRGTAIPVVYPYAACHECTPETPRG